MIYVECNADYALVKTLGVSRKEITHCRGKGKVCRLLERKGKRNCKGLVDEDPFAIQPPYLKRLQLKEDLSSSGIKILNDRSSNKKVIILCPRLEDWILKATTEAQVDIRKYNLPDNSDDLHKHMNINRFERLIDDLMERSNRVKVLKRFLLS